MPEFRQIAERFGRKDNIELFGQEIRHVKAYVVTGVFVFGAYIAKAYDEVFHRVRFFFLFCKQLFKKREHEVFG